MSGMMSTLSSAFIAVRRKRLVAITVATIMGWYHERVSRLAAALSFYALLSLVPLILTFHAVFGLLIDQQVLAKGVDNQVASFIGPDQAKALRAMLEHARAPSFASAKAIVGSVVTFVTAAGVFIALKDSMDAIWRTQQSQRPGILTWLRAYFAPMSMVLGFGFLMLISLLLDALLHAMATSLVVWNPALLAFLATGNLVIGWVAAALMFAGIFRWLPASTIAWRDVWLGAVLTATFFIIGRVVIGFYLGRSDFTGQYGPAGAIVAIMVWIYYSAQIVFTGAVFTREHARIAGNESAKQEEARREDQRSWLDEGGAFSRL